MNIETEKTRKLTTEQISIIEDLAVQAANDGGFMNRFIHERAIYVFAAVILYPEKKEELDKLIGAGYDIRAAFDKIVDDGTLEDMVEDYVTDIDNLLAIGEQWFMDAAEFLSNKLINVYKRLRLGTLLMFSSLRSNGALDEMASLM